MGLSHSAKPFGSTRMVRLGGCAPGGAWLAEFLLGVGVSALTLNLKNGGLDSSHGAWGYILVYAAKGHEEAWGIVLRIAATSVLREFGSTATQACV